MSGLIDRLFLDYEKGSVSHLIKLHVFFHNFVIFDYFEEINIHEAHRLLMRILYRQVFCENYEFT